MMKIKRQNKLRTYLAVTAGVGCAGSVANAAVVRLDLSTVAGTNGGVDPGANRISVTIATNASIDVYNDRFGITGIFGSGFLFIGASDGLPNIVGSGVSLDGSGSYEVRDGAFVYAGRTAPAIDGVGYLPFRIGSNAGVDTIGFFQVTFDGESEFEILGGAFESVAGNPITTFDTTAVPEPSSLVLLALGATGLAARRKRKMAA